MYKYKFRAECELDVEMFRTMLGDMFTRISMTIERSFPDVEVELQTDIPIELIKNYMKQVPDGHTMLSTLKELTNEPR